MADTPPIPLQPSFEAKRNLTWLAPALIFLYQLAVLGCFIYIPISSHSQPLSFADLVANLILPYLGGLVFLVCSAYILYVRRFDLTGRTFAVFAASAALAIAGLREAFTTPFITGLWLAALALAAGSLVGLALVFPKESRLLARYPWLAWSGYALAAVLISFSLVRPEAARLAVWLGLGFLALAGLLFLGLAFWHWRRTTSPVVREQARLVLLSYGLTLGLLLVASGLEAMINNRLVFPPWLLVITVIFPVFVGYAILRHRLLNTDVVLNRALVYSLLVALAVGSYALLVAGLSVVSGTALPANSPLLIGLMVFLLAICLDPLRSFLTEKVDAVFFKGQVVFRNRLDTFGHELTQAMELPSIVSLLHRYVSQDFQPAQLHIFVHDPLSDDYSATSGTSSRPTTDVRFPGSSSLVQSLAKRHDALFFGNTALEASSEGPRRLELPPVLQAEQARLALLDCEVFVPLPGRKSLIGWLALGPRRSGEPYTDRDLNFLESLSDQAALAVERAQVVADLERRVRETNVLTRVAQGTNFTVAYDDILELIFAQTSQVIPTRDYRVLLKDKHSEMLSYAFFLENDERLSEREGKMMPVHSSLEAEVIDAQRSLLTDDYERECRVHSLLPDMTGVFAWMAVPLNAGAETFGAVCLGSRDPAITFTDDQRNLFQAIADQAAGAIVKARLLQEAEQRARQLALLNEIARGLTSTLELKPLLNKILVSATEILNCDAGSLLLVDPQTDELVFEVVIGPVADTLTGKRLPAGTGLAGQAVQTARPIIANDAKRRKEWFGKTDSQTGFDTQDLLVAPMMVQERVIGVIEVINKRDHTPFVASDQELLATFTGQASVALENARLYTLTDQALAARVEELSVMQRIDRELNASLEIDRALRITLEWAMRQSRVDAGLIGVVSKEGTRVMLSQGYGNELGSASGETDAVIRSDGGREAGGIYLPNGLPGVARAIETGQVQCLYAAGAGQAAFAVLAGGAAQAVVPIRREAEVMGVLVLESRSSTPLAEDDLAFLSRLSDHAAIAIANSRLYEEVQAANLAKSKFVSFVAHELKNPMAVIKGYTELVAGGMAGPVNELQSGFLGTIRQNVDRMNSIVSDLNDLTKLQVGSLRLNFSAVSLADSMNDVVRSLKWQIEGKKQNLISKLPEKLPLVWADGGRMSQILTNLVSNAHKYTPEGGDITVGAEVWANEDQAASGVDYVHVWVKDTGIGIPPEDQPKIFQSYFRTEISKDAASGTGLGLNITRSLVEMQGGRIWFESELQAGSTFHILVPVAQE